MTTAIKTHVLVATEWLAEHLGDPDLAIIEVDEDAAAFATGYIPGAVAIDWKTELRANPRRYRDVRNYDGSWTEYGILVER